MDFYLLNVNFRLARKYQSPLEIRKSTESTLNVTPVRAADCFREQSVNDDEGESISSDKQIETTKAKSKGKKPSSKALTPTSKTTTTRGKKRKVDEESTQVECHQVSLEEVPKPTKKLRF